MNQRFMNAVVNHPQQGDHTAIWWAALTGRKQVVRLLLGAGATVEESLAPAVRKALVKPYYGHNLPPREDYEAVIQMLEKHASR